MTTQKKTWFITGSSSGFGREMVLQLLAAGHHVVATARKPEVLADLAAEYPETLLTAELDVTKSDTITNAVTLAISRFENIDILVNNAGYGLTGAIEEASEADIQAQFDTNVFGLIRVTNALLPHFRAREQGHILNLSSVAGLNSFPGFGIYCASKFAVEAISEALAVELSGVNVKVTLIEPGAFRTEFAGGSLRRSTTRIEDYGNTAHATISWLESMDGKQPGDPVKAVAAMIAVTEQAEPPLRLPLGEDCLTVVDAKLERLKANIDQVREIAANMNLDGVETPKLPG